MVAGSFYDINAGALLNLSSISKKQHMVRAIYEGVIFSSLFHISRIKMNGAQIKKVKLCGGIANSEVWPQIACDAIGMPLEVMDAKEPGALGAAICASIAAGYYPDIKSAVGAMVHVRKVFKPDLSQKAVYKRKYENYIRAVKALDLFYNGDDTMQIIPSIVSANLLCIGEELKKAEVYGGLHLDIEDGNFSPYITFGMDLVSQIARNTDLKMDAHLMVANPFDYILPLAENKVSAIAFRLESTRCLFNVLRKHTIWR